MDWLKDILKTLPLESISEVLAKVVFWWTQLVSGVPEEVLAFNTYVIGSLLVLLLLYWVLKIVPPFLRGIIWCLSAAILLTPGETIADTGGTAPAVIGVLHGFLMGEPAAAMSALLPILAVTIVLLIIGAIWKYLRAYLSSSDDDYGDYDDEAHEEHDESLATDAR